MRVRSFLTNQAVQFEALMHPPAYCAQKRAKYLHVSGRQVVKAVVLVGPAGYVLAVAPATHQLDMPRLAEQLGGPVRLATAEQLQHLFPDCEAGAVPPLGVLYGLPTLLDNSIAPESTIVFEGNTHFEAIRMHCRDYERLEQPRRFTFAARREAPARAARGAVSRS